MTPRQRQIAWILGARRRQVERELGREAFQEAASSAEGHDTGAKLFDQPIKVLPGDGDFMGIRARAKTPVMRFDPNPPVGWSAVVSSLKSGQTQGPFGQREEVSDVGTVAHRLVDAARQSFGHDFGPYEFVVTHGAWRMCRTQFDLTQRDREWAGVRVHPDDS